MLQKIFHIICKRYPKLRKLFWNKIYQMISMLYKRKEWIFMNYGFAPIETKTNLFLKTHDIDNKYFIWLYHHVVNSIDLSGRDVLEIGCGRGGGASYIKRYLKPKKMVAIDLSKKAIKFCKEIHSIKNLHFFHGDAENLFLKNSYFDIILNIESCHCYTSIDKFINEVYRVLKPGGYFLIADVGFSHEIIKLNEHLETSNFKLLKKSNITKNIIKALELDAKQRIDLFKKFIPGFLINLFQEFAGNNKSNIYTNLKSGISKYYSYVLQKKVK